jgi:EAL domain-containing protein (putative c-di-GMP-specific phosphodiesterase class I)
MLARPTLTSLYHEGSDGRLVESVRDVLTGLLSREPSLNELQEKLRGLTANQGSLCLVFMDLNKFKPINDTYGHDVGERLLGEMSPGNAAGRRATESGGHGHVPRQAESGCRFDRAEATVHRTELLQALTTDGLEMYLHPIGSVKNGLVVGFEVLPRWQHPDYGLLELEHFHPMLVHSEEGKAFDRWLILTAARLSANFQDRGFHIGIGVNLTRRQLVLDHFGGGTSSMEFASRLPLDFIKLNEDLSHDLSNAPERQCDLIQGKLWSEPLTLAEVEQCFLRDDVQSAFRLKRKKETGAT